MWLYETLLLLLLLHSTPTSLPFIPFLDVKYFFNVHILSVHLLAASIFWFAAAKTLLTSTGSLDLPARIILSYSFSSLNNSWYWLNFIARSLLRRNSLCWAINFFDSSIAITNLAIWSIVLSCSFFFSWAALLGKDQKKFALPILSLWRAIKGVRER